MDLDSTHPSISDLAARARRRIPGFVWDYLDSATGNEAAKHRNRAALDGSASAPRSCTARPSRIFPPIFLVDPMPGPSA
jgi:hypothetical protein